MIEQVEKEGVIIVKEAYDTSRHSIIITKQKERVDLALKVANEDRNT
jgi:hypothetical protein